MFKDRTKQNATAYFRNLFPFDPANDAYVLLGFVVARLHVNVRDVVQCIRANTEAVGVPHARRIGALVVRCFSFVLLVVFVI